jgi:hypothetical protein
MSIWPTIKNFEQQNGTACFNKPVIRLAEPELAVTFCDGLQAMFGMPVAINSDYGDYSIQVLLESEAGIKPEGYCLSIAENHTDVIASDHNGVLYGLERLRQMIEHQENGSCVLPMGTLRENPFKAIRGCYFSGLPAYNDLPFFKRFIQYFLLPLRINTMYIEPNASMRFDLSPEINYQGFSPYGGGRDELERPLQKHEVRDLIAFAGTCGITMVPVFETLSHSDWLLNSHPELAECENKNGLLFNICPCHPGYRPLATQCLEEILSVFDSETVLIGHDEWTRGGKCPRCVNKDTLDLFVDDVLYWKEYLDQKGRKTAIFSDHLVDWHHGKSVSEDNVYWTPDTIGAGQKLGELASDMIVYNWSGPGSTEELWNQGFRDIIKINWNYQGEQYDRPWNRLADEGLVKEQGAVCSAWMRTEPGTLMHSSFPHELFLNAQLLWNGDSPDDEQVGESMVEVFPESKALIDSYEFPNSDIKHNPQFVSIPLPKKILSALPELQAGQYCRSGIPLEVSDKIASGDDFSMNVGGKMARLCFLHAADREPVVRDLPPPPRLLTDKFEMLGFYSIEYENGFLVTIPIRYGIEIAGFKCTWRNDPFADQYGNYNRRQWDSKFKGFFMTQFSFPLWDAPALRIGSHSDGAGLYFNTLIWDNPFPDQGIKAIRFQRICDAPSAAQLFLAAITGIEKRDVFIPSYW